MGVIYTARQYSRLHSRPDKQGFQHTAIARWFDLAYNGLRSRFIEHPLHHPMKRGNSNDNSRWR
jgi:hypothetical protein